MRRELIEAINIQAKRDGFYLPIIKAVVFEELSKKYKTKPLSEVLNSSRGGSWGEDYLIDGLEAISLRSPDIRHGFIDFDNGKKRFYEKSNFSKFQLDDGDVIVIKSNGSLDLVGKSQVYFSNPEYPNVTASNFLMILKPNKALVSPLYLDIFLKSPQSLIWRVEKQRTTTGLRNLDSKGYLSLEIPLPETLDEQEKVAEIINNLVLHEFPKNEIFNISTIELASKISERFNELLNEFEKNTNQLIELKQSILQEAIQGKLTADWREKNQNIEPANELLKRIKEEKTQLIKDKKIKKEKPLPPIKKEEIKFELPDGWVWCRVGDICKNITSGSTPSKDSFNSNEIPYLKVYNIRNQEIDFNYKPQFIKQSVHESSLKRCILKPGDVVMNIVGPPLGKVAIIPNTFPEWNCNQAISIFRCIEESINPFIYKYLCAGLYLNYLHYKGMAGQDNISVTMCKELIIGLPPIEEQKAIVEKVDFLMKKHKALEHEIKTSEANAQMLMQAVLKEAFESKEEMVLKDT